MFGLLKSGLKSIAAGRTQADLGLQSPHLPNAITRVARFFYSFGGLWIAGVWYSGYVNMRTAPGSGPKLILPGTPVVGSPDRPDRKPKFANSVTQSNSQSSATSNQFVTTPSQAGRTLIALNPKQIGVPGTAVAGYLWSAPNNEKQIPGFNRARYNALLGVANSIARQFGLHITSGYRPQSTGSLHAAGIAFDMVGAMSNMKRAATWAANNPSLFQEIFIHNEGSGMHLHLGFYPDAAGIFNSGANRLVRPTATAQKHAVRK